MDMKQSWLESSVCMSPGSLDYVLEARAYVLLVFILLGTDSHQELTIILC